MADILNDVALFLELLAPLFPFMFMMIICAASAAKVNKFSQCACFLSCTDCATVQAIVGVAGGATRAALVQHQARRDNMADVSAKDGSQVSV